MNTGSKWGLLACCSWVGVLFMTFGGTPVALAETLSVSPSGGEFPNIQAAVTAAASGDTVFLSPGSYAGAGNVNIDFQGKALCVMGGGRDLVVIDCESAARAFCLNTNQGEGTRIQGLSIINGNATELPGGTGGAVRLTSGHLALVDVEIRDCIAGDGGGVSSYWSHLQMENVSIANCSASFQGGGLKVLGVGSFSMTGTTVAGCSAWQGGGVFLGGVTLGEITATQVLGNSTGDQGGGVHISACETITLTEVSLDSNQSNSDRGGALYANYSQVSLVGCRLRWNTAEAGGACYFHDCSLAEIKTSLIAHNSGLYSSAAAAFIMCERSRVSNCTIAHNACTISYGNDQGALLFNSDQLAVIGNIIAFSAKDCGLGISSCEQVQIECNNVYGNEVDGYCEDLDDLTGIDGNIAVDPMFCDTLDYCLSSASPCRAENNDCNLTMGAVDCTCDLTAVGSAPPTQTSGIRLEYSREHVVVFADDHEGHGSWRLEAYDVTGRQAGQAEGVYTGPRLELTWPSLLQNQASGAYFLRFSCNCGATTSKKALVAK